MLKGIPKILSPELLKVLCEMGHGDAICIGDGNFPAESMGKNAIVLRYDGHSIPELLDAILSVFPLDPFVEQPVSFMSTVGSPTPVNPTIWNEYIDIISKYDDRGASAIQYLERFNYYDESKKCYAIIATGESASYANIILKKGCVSQ